MILEMRWRWEVLWITIGDYVGVLTQVAKMLAIWKVFNQERRRHHKFIVPKIKYIFIADTILRCLCWELIERLDWFWWWTWNGQLLRFRLMENEPSKSYMLQNARKPLSFWFSLSTQYIQSRSAGGLGWTISTYLRDGYSKNSEKFLV